MSHRYPMQATLKNGHRVTLRPVEVADWEALARFYSALPPEDTLFLKRDVRDPEVVRKFVCERSPEERWTLVALEADGRIVAESTLYMHRIGWRRHVGEVRLVVSRELQHQRLATALLHELTEQATVRGLRKMEAQILDAQLGARLALEQLGFREEARLRGHALDLDGVAHDLLIFTNSVEDLWHKMEDLISDLDLVRDGY